MKYQEILEFNMKYQEISTSYDKANLVKGARAFHNPFMYQSIIYTQEEEQELYVTVPQVLKTEEGARAERREEGRSLVLIHITAR